jgi:hypothetical protein
VLIGPGTGVAPFVGFAQHRLAQGVDDAARGKLELYFGTAENGVSFPPSPSVFLLCVASLSGQTIVFHMKNMPLAAHRLPRGAERLPLSGGSGGKRCGRRPWKASDGILA